MANRSPSKDPQKLNPLLSEFLSFGCLSGFRYFETYLRGREELIIRVFNDSKTPIFSAHPHAHSNAAQLVKEGSSNLVLSYRTQRLLSLQTFSGLPPASPADRDLEKDSTKTAFLIAGYARYGKPFVWLEVGTGVYLSSGEFGRLRSHHNRLLQSHGGDNTDSPLTLASTNNWPKADVKLADIVAELVTLALHPPPSNPFAIDHAFFDSIPLEESIVLSGAMVDFLSKLYTRRSQWSEGVFEDLKILQRRHFTDLNEYVTKSAASGGVTPTSSTEAVF